MGKTRQYPGPPGNISNLKLDFSWLMLWICFIYFSKLESSIVKLNRSVLVLGQQGVVCSPTTMLAILDHSLAGMIYFFFLFFMLPSLYFPFLVCQGVVVKRLPVQSIPVLVWLQNPVPTMSPLFKGKKAHQTICHQ